MLLFTFTSLYISVLGLLFVCGRGEEHDTLAGQSFRGSTVRPFMVIHVLLNDSTSYNFSLINANLYLSNSKLTASLKTHEHTRETRKKDTQKLFNDMSKMYSTNEELVSISFSASYYPSRPCTT